MGAKEIKELWESLSKNRIMKVFIIALTGLITIGIAVIVIKISFGDHVKFAGFEINDEPKKEFATVLQKNPPVTTPAKDASSPRDTPIIKDVSQKITLTGKRLQTITTRDSSKSKIITKPYNIESNGDANQNNGTNSGSIGGKNNFNGGNGKYYASINVGDTYINAQKLLSDKYLNYIYQYVDSLQRVKDTKKVIYIGTDSYSNAPDVENQVIAYFKEKGYRAVFATIMVNPNAPTTYGFAVSPLDKEGIQMEVGIFKQ